MHRLALACYARLKLSLNKDRKVIKYRMNIKMQSFKRTAYVAVALVLSAVGLVEGVFINRAFADPVAGNQVSERAIRMSSSLADDTPVNYLVSFIPGTSHSIAGIILQFCDSTSTPLVDDSTCVAPTDLDVDTGITIDSTPGDPDYDDLTGTWSVAGDSTNNILKITVGTPVAVSNANADPYAFEIQGINNPSVVGTFYARIITYDSVAAGADFDDYATGSPNETGSTTDDAIDYGGFALSTAFAINISAKVIETMTFCLSGVDPGPSCGAGAGVDPTQPSLVLGEGVNNVLTTGAISTDDAYMQLSTNAQGGAVMRMKIDNASGGLEFNTNTIPATGDGVLELITAGTAAFGMHVVDVVTGTGAVITPDANYDDTTADNYGMDTDATGAGSTDLTSVLTTYGDPIASTTGALNSRESILRFAATASNTTPAGNYIASAIIIATGTF